MAHLLHHRVQSEHIPALQFKHRLQRMLHKRPAGSSCQAIALFLRQQMRRMVGSHNIDIPACQRCSQCRTVLPCFNCGIPLYQIPIFRVIAIGKPQMVNARFRRDALLLQRDIFKQFQFPCSREMQHMQISAILMRHLHCPGRRFVAHFRASYQRMVVHRQIVAIFFLIKIFIAADQSFVFRMNGNDGRHIRKNRFQRVAVIDKHIARRRA